MEQGAPGIVEWLSLEILPHEADARAWIRSASVGPAEEDDIIQEVYCRLLEESDIGGVVQPRVLFLRLVRETTQAHLRQVPVVSIDIASVMDELEAPEAISSPELIAHDRRVLSQVREVVSTFPPRCREVFELRKMWGLTQKDVSRRLHISEKTVEKETTRGLWLLMRALARKSESHKPNRAEPNRRAHADPASSRRNRLGGGGLGGQGRRGRSQSR